MPTVPTTIHRPRWISKEIAQLVGKTSNEPQHFKQILHLLTGKPIEKCNEDSYSRMYRLLAAEEKTK